MPPSKPYSRADLTAGATGSLTGAEEVKKVVVTFGPYEVIVRLTSDGRFVDIDQLRIKKDFLSPEQRAAGSGCFDVDEFYEEE